MSENNRITIRVWGDFACFTRPEMKVERVSYPVMTPSAARGILEAIYWEPQMFYLIDSIRVVKRGGWISFRRNEVNDVISISKARQWMKSPEKVEPIQSDDTGNDGSNGLPKRAAVRAQRNMLALREVEYLITAEVRMTVISDRPDNSIAKYVGQIERRAKQGKCFHRPSFGVREFAVDFEWVEESPDKALEARLASLGKSAADESEELGLMLYDVFDPMRRADGFRWLREEELAVVSQGGKSGRRSSRMPIQRWMGALVKPQPAFFHAEIKNSVMDCHPDRVKILTSVTSEEN